MGDAGAGGADTVSVRVCLGIGLLQMLPRPWAVSLLLLCSFSTPFLKFGDLAKQMFISGSPFPAQSLQVNRNAVLRQDILGA